MGKPCPQVRQVFPASKLVVAVREVSYHSTHLKEKPNRHLEHTIIPTLSRLNSLEDFLDRSRPPLSFFAAWISSGNHRRVLAIRKGVVPDSLHVTQSRLHCTQHFYTPHIRFHPSQQTDVTPIHRVGSPRRLVRDLHAVASRPKSLTPSNSPNLGKRSRHQKLHRYALRRYFTPASESVRSDQNTAPPL